MSALSRFKRQNSEYLDRNGTFIIQLMQDERLKHTTRKRFTIKKSHGNVTVTSHQHSRLTLARTRSNQKALSYLKEHRLEIYNVLLAFYPDTQHLPNPPPFVTFVNDLKQVYVIIGQEMICGYLSLFQSTSTTIERYKVELIFGGFDWKWCNPHRSVYISQNQEEKTDNNDSNDRKSEEKTEDNDDDDDDDDKPPKIQFYAIAELPHNLCSLAIAQVHISDYIKSRYNRHKLGQAETICIDEILQKGYETMILTFGGIAFDVWNEFDDYESFDSKIHSDDQKKTRRLMRGFENGNIYVFFLKYQQGKYGHGEWYCDVRMCSGKTNIRGALQPNAEIICSEHMTLVCGFCRIGTMNVSSKAWCLVLDNMIMSYYSFGPSKSIKITKLYGNMSETIPLDRILLNLHPIGVCNNIESSAHCRMGVYPYFAMPWRNSCHCGQCGGSLSPYQNWFPHFKV